MKIICVEEHTVDGPVEKAAQALMARDAPYVSTFMSQSTGGRSSEADERPRMVGLRRAMELIHQPLSARLAEMDANGIDMQILSYSSMTQYAPVSQAAELARAANDRLAGIIRENPGRFGGFSTLPWQDPGAAGAELERAVQQLGLHATLLVGRPGDTFLDDPRYDAVLTKLEELDAAIYLHPGLPLPQVQKAYYAGFSQEVTATLSLAGWGWHNEAGIHVIRLILSGVLDRHPRLKIISGHWGEMVPFYLQRMDDALPREMTGLTRSISQTYKDQVFVTPSGMLNLPHFKFIHEVLGAERLLYSVDYPYLSLTGARRFLETLPIPEREKELISHVNVERLLRV